MSSSSEAAEPLRRAIRRLAAAGGPHPSPEAIVAYREGRSEPDAEEEIREHLAGCPECATDLLELDSLLAGEPRPGTEEISGAEIEAAWARQRARSFAAQPAARRESRRRRVSVVTSGLALAASILASVTVVQWHRIARLEAPQGNPPMLLLAPKGSAREGAPAVPRLEFSKGSQSAWLVLDTETDLDVAAYEIEKIGPGGTVLLRISDLRSDDAGNLRLEVSRRDLPAGRHRLLLYGRRGVERRAIGEYEFEVVSGSLE